MQLVDITEEMAYFERAFMDGSCSYVIRDLHGDWYIELNDFNALEYPADIELDYELTDEEKAEFEHVRTDPNLLTSVYANTLREGYNMSEKWLPNEGCFRTSLTCTIKDSPAFGYVLAMRGKDPLTSKERVLYAHHYLLGGDWSDYVGASRSNTDW